MVVTEFIIQMILKYLSLPDLLLRLVIEDFLKYLNNYALAVTYYHIVFCLDEWERELKLLLVC